MGAENDPFIDSLRGAGLEEVRRRLATDVYGEGGNRRAIATNWVAEEERRLEAEAQRERDATQTRVADTADRQATTAEKATRIAIGALVISAIAAILSVIALARH
jgi:hypothetical protein